MKILIIILIPAAVLLALSLVYRKWLEVTHVAVETEKESLGVRICHISDLHDYRYGADNCRLFEIIKKESPDYVCITGDYINRANTEPEKSLGLIKRLTDEGFVVLYVPGNHELGQENHDPEKYLQYVKALKDLNVVYLDDEFYEDEKVKILGYTNKLSQYTKYKGLYPLTSEEIKSELSEKSEGRPEINGGASGNDKLFVMLVHNPVYFKEYAAFKPDLVLAGHLHGGIIRLPFFGGILSPQTFFSTRYTGGLYTNPGNKKQYMYVSRGLGLHTIHLRLFNRPELGFIKLNGKGL